MLRGINATKYYSPCFTVSPGSAPLCGRRPGGWGHGEWWDPAGGRASAV